MKDTMTNIGTEHIESCADFQSLIPAYLNNGSQKLARCC